jgi:energy-coupling factor transporter transmembrane protein EcfT
MVRIAFEYSYRDTLLHNTNPIAVAFILVFMAGLVVMWWNPILLLAIFIIALVLAKKSEVPMGWVKTLIFLGAMSSLLETFFGSLTSAGFFFMTDPTFFKVLSPEFAMTEIFQLTPHGFPLLGYTAVTYGTLTYLAAIWMKYPVNYTLGCVLVWCVNPSDLFQYFVALRFPNQITLPLMAAFRFFPVMTEVMSNIVNAQTLRGWTVRNVRNPVKFVRMLIPFTYPLGRQFVRLVDTVTISTLNRGFGSKRMSPRREMKLNALEWMIVGLVPPLFVLIFYLTVTPPWYLGAI